MYEKLHTVIITETFKSLLAPIGYLFWIKRIVRNRFKFFIKESKLYDFSYDFFNELCDFFK